MNYNEYLNIVRENYRTELIKFLELIKKNGTSNNFAVFLQKDLLDKTNNGISLGIFYLLLSNIETQSIPIENKMEIALRLDIVFSLADFLDDILDEDNEKNLPKNDQIINILTLLFTSIHDLCSFTSSYLDTTQLISFFSEAIDGERIDFYSKFSQKTNSDNYFSKMLKKSTSLFQLIGYIAYPKKQIIWSNFSKEIATSFQLQNDALDIIDINKADLSSYKETLPLIKSVEYARNDGNTKFLKLVKKNLTDISSLNYLISYIKNSGAIEYTLKASSLYAEKAFQTLQEAFPDHEETITLLSLYIKGGKSK